MRWVLEDDLMAFAPAVLPWLERQPVLNNVLCTLIGSRYTGEQPIEAGSVWARLVDATGTVQAVAIRTPPHPVLVSPLSPTDAEALVDALGSDLTGVSGLAEAVGAVLAAWRRRGGTAELTMSQRLYELDAVTPPTGVDGKLRAATSGDEQLAVDWTLGFYRDAGIDAHPPEVEATLAYVAAGRLWIWEVDGEPASMASDRVPAAGVVRISLVYTPPEHRRRGYASACVAALSQLMLDRGAKACMLYTDLANPTSNAIYQTVGYRPVTDAEIWTFPR
jgi:predicted GNAT family acetyltransferase